MNLLRRDSVAEESEATQVEEDDKDDGLSDQFEAQALSAL